VCAANKTMPTNKAVRPHLSPVANRALFNLGALYATPGALRELASAGMNPFHLFKRHQSGDWGVLDASDYEANERVVCDGSRIVSVYRDGAMEVMVITEATDDRGIRSCTTALLPVEY
jgi:hypothetical protein